MRCVILGLVLLVASLSASAQEKPLTVDERIALIRAMQDCWTQQRTNIVDNSKEKITADVGADIDGAFKKIFSIAGGVKGGFKGDFKETVWREFEPIKGSEAQRTMINACFEGAFGRPLPQNLGAHPIDASTNPKDGTSKEGRQDSRKPKLQGKKRDPLRELDESLKTDDFSRRSIAVRAALETKDAQLRHLVEDRVLRSGDPSLQQIVIIKYLKQREKGSVALVANPSGKDDWLSRCLTGKQFHIYKVDEDSKSIDVFIMPISPAQGSMYPVVPGTILRSGLAVNAKIECERDGTPQTEELLFMFALDNQHLGLVGTAQTKSGVTVNVGLPIF